MAVGLLGSASVAASAAEPAIGLGGAFPIVEDMAEAVAEPASPGLRLSDPRSPRPHAGGLGVPGTPFIDFDRPTYFTPRVLGLQMGMTADAGEGASGPGRGGPATGMLNYQGQLGSVRLGASLTYEASEGDRQFATDDATSLGAGLQASFHGFDLSYGYFWTENSGVRVHDRRAHAAGLGYSWGPFRIGLSVLDPIGDGGKQGALSLGSPDDDARRYSLGGVYSVGPGLQLGASVNMNEAKGTDGRSTPEGNDSNLLFLFGTVVRF